MKKLIFQSVPLTFRKQPLLKQAPVDRARKNESNAGGFRLNKRAEGNPD